jgi:recombination protein U
VSNFKSTSHVNRGMNLEAEVIKANLRYDALGLAVINKVSTPIQVIRNRETRKIDGAFFKEKSTVDFVGISKGKYLTFDAKETKNKTSFPMKNIKQEQYEHLKKVNEQKGISFLLIYFVAHDEKYILTIDQLIYWKEQEATGRKSIPYEFFKENCKQCYPGLNVAINYLPVLEI